MNNYEAMLALSTMHEFPADRLRMVLKSLGGATAVFELPQNELENFLKDYYLHPRLKHELLKIHDNPDISNIMRIMEKEKIHFITEQDEGFPEKLKKIRSAPLYLFYSGRLPAATDKSIGVIGSRNCSPYGKEIALCFSKVLAKCGISIISGMARGIDGYAHMGALEAEGFTVAALGFGPDICYPKENYGLMQKIKATGCLISEYAPGTSASALHFPARNRIISGLSDGILVIEAAKKSGTLITVDYGLEQGKNIYAVPGRIGDVLSEGCNELIKNGCMPVTHPEEILRDFGFELKTEDAPTENVYLKNNAVKILGCLDKNVKYTDELLIETGLELNVLLSELLELELKGFINEPVQGGYIKIPGIRIEDGVLKRDGAYA